MWQHGPLCITSHVKIIQRCMTCRVDILAHYKHLWLLMFSMLVVSSWLQDVCLDCQQPNTTHINVYTYHIKLGRFKHAAKSQNSWGIQFYKSVTSWLFFLFLFFLVMCVLRYSLIYFSSFRREAGIIISPVWKKINKRGGNMIYCTT